MTIRYIDPLSRGWGRMKAALFQPFDIRKWFVVGFTAFLAGLTDFQGGGGGSGIKGRDGDVDWNALFYFPDRIREWMSDNPFWFPFLLVAVAIALVLLALLFWVSSRGKFMFLDNVVRDRSEVSAPWYEYRKEGNSLFLWHAVFSIVFAALLIPYLISCFTALREIWETFGDPRMFIAPGIWMVLGFAGIMMLASFIDLMLADFVVPLMYRSRVGVLKGWGLFLPLFWSRLLYFVGYAIFYLLLVLVLVFAIVVGGVVTCCIGFLILALPYIGTVLLLPVHYTFRAFSLEFLEQFGPEYRILPGQGPPMFPTVPSGSAGGSGL
ncbi:MAG: hypothetical protein WB626_07940 [Bacteroidota bacterium]